MQTTPLSRLRAEAKRQLYNYRKNTARAYRTSAQRAEYATEREWIRAINAARMYFRAKDPLKERFMERLFGLEIAVPRKQMTRARMILLEQDLCVTVSTLYKWREDILEIVLYAAIEAGLLCPFGLERKPSEAERAEKPSN